MSYTIYNHIEGYPKAIGCIFIIIIKVIAMLFKLFHIFLCDANLVHDEVCVKLHSESHKKGMLT